MTALRLGGRLSALTRAERALLLQRSFASGRNLEAPVRDILARVRAEGDAALLDYTRRFDKVSLPSLEVPPQAWEAAAARLEPELLDALRRLARNVHRVSAASLPAPLLVEVEPGVRVGRRAEPVERAGVYAPGGKAAYPSSVLMGVVPARAAGVGEVVVCSPPGPTGVPSDVVLAAALVGKADRVFAVGGAQAIAALAHGTASIPRVQRIVGPGNAWVAEAKRQVAGLTGIDSPAGPSEILVIADETASPRAVALELLAQAEHDEDACVVALLTTGALAQAVRAEVEAALSGQQRREVITQALQRRGAILEVSSLDEAVHFANTFAAEHLLVATARPDELLPRLRSAGTIFVGHHASVAFGDYLTGGNHVLPTAGLAASFSGLSVLDFVRLATWQEVSAEGAARLAQDAHTLARSEGLYAHAEAAQAHAGQPGAMPAEPLRTRPALAPIQRYLPTRPPVEVDLSDNTNLFGVCPPVERLLRQGPPPAAVTRYPTPYADALRAALASRHGVEAACVVTGAGSDDVLASAFHALAEPGERLAYCPPTFGIIPAFAQAAGLTPVPCPLDVRALAASGARLVYLCAPNNPTGALLPEGFLEALLQGSGALVILDEAYQDYAARPSFAARAVATPRVLVVRTLSKASGLAGLRLGYGLAHPSLVLEVEKTRGPYKVGGLAEACALAALGEGRGWVEDAVARTVENRARLAGALQARGLSPLPSQANFLLVPVASDAVALAGALRERGVSVRAFAAVPGVGEALRVTVGPWPLMERFLAALQEVLPR